MVGQQAKHVDVILISYHGFIPLLLYNCEDLLVMIANSLSSNGTYFFVLLDRACISEEI